MTSTLWITGYLLVVHSVCFTGKPSVKIISCIFQCLVVQKKTSQRKIIFSQQKTLIKIRLIFYRLFSNIFFWKTISLSLIASSINIIFFCRCGKHNFLTLCLSHGKLSHFFSLFFTFSLIIYSLLWISILIFFSLKNFQFDGFQT